ncbi:hypothetical protein EOD42_07590 [Rhodovarius crocodyli]|uniref:Uncharacterized protein n=2 Tax=Rhodovarius crocodyli TaxID=1979269 RepID=A0A437MJ66_9PROT|nr:hypothetical protein EOD42_07590 [Rhodovarius crocodyli]
MLASAVAGTAQPNATMAPGNQNSRLLAIALMGGTQSNPLIREYAQSLLPMAQAGMERDAARLERREQRADDQRFQLGRDAAGRAHAESMARLTAGLSADNQRPIPGQPGTTFINPRTGQPVYTVPRSGAFEGTSMTAQATNLAMQLGPKIADGTATPEEVALYRRAYTFLREGGAPQEVADPNDPTGQRRVLAMVPRDVSDLPPPPSGSQQAPQAGTQPPRPRAAPLPVAPIDPGTPQRPGPVPGTVAEPPAVTDPNAPRIIPGTARRDQPLTDAQGRANMFGQAAEGADRILSRVRIPSAPVLAAWRNLPEGAVNPGLDANDQQYFNAVRQFAAGVLRRETGAAFTNQELLDVQTRFFPSPGDSREVIEQKANARRQVIESMRAEMPGGAFRGGQPAGSVPPLPPGFREVR